MTSRALLSLLLCSVPLAACGPSAGTDAGTTDLGAADLGAHDAGDVDQGPDAGVDPCRGTCGTGQVCCVEGLLGRCETVADVSACPMPDLTVDPDAATGDLITYWRYFAPGSCEEMEACIDAPGWRRLLGFSTLTPNVGNADVRIGAPSTHDPHFQYSACHMHFHFLGYADYALMDGTTVAAHGHKQAFCLEDFQQYSSGAGIPTNAVYDCSNQGISQGWADNYYSGLPCQWIDITDVAPGSYSLQIAVNQTHALTESNYDNDIATVPVTIAADGPVDVTGACTASAAPVERDCSWQVATTGASCVPGATVSIACGAACGGGACTGDPVMRICDGSAPCGNRDALGLGDDGCGGDTSPDNSCPTTEFTCPASGTYTVLVGSFFLADPFTCVPAVVRETLPDGGVVSLDGGTGPSDASTGG